MTAIDSFEFNALPDSLLLAWLTAAGRRPNVLIEYAPGTADTIMQHVTSWCGLPFRYCTLPGKLDLPTTRQGTLLLRDVSALNVAQQVALYDWLSAGVGEMQVISLTSAPLAPFVEQGRFLEGLHYRLNIIRLDAVNGTRPAPLPDWRDSRDATA